MHIDLLHFDTLLGSYNNNSVYDCTFVLSNPLRNVQNIYLKSIELPISFNNIRSANGTNTFKITVNAVTYTITLNEYSYTSINTLLNDINIQVQLVLPNISFTLNSNKKVTITNTGTVTTIVFSPSRLLNVVLGFTQLSYSTSFIAENNYLLAYDNYISMYLQDIPVKSTGYSNQLISFKIPLNAVNGMVYYLQEFNSFSQSVEITDKNYVLNRLRVVLYDRFGCKLSNGLDYTFSLAVNYHRSEI